MMSKKKIAVGAGSLLGVITVVLIGPKLLVGLRQSKSAPTELVSPSGEGSSRFGTVDNKEEKLKVYNDEAGFSFNYSDTLSIKEVENQDESTYSWLEITSTSRPGEKMTIKLTDTNLTTVDEWLKKNKQVDWSVNETVIGGMNGKLVKAPLKIFTIAVQKGILFLIESPADKEGFWEKQQKIIGESFKVAWPTPKQTSAPAGDSSGIEEIIE